MSEIDHQASKHGDKAPGKAPDENTHQSKAHLLEGVYNPPANDLNGKKCRTQPKLDEFASLAIGSPTKGCDFKKFSQITREYPKDPEFQKLYEKAKLQSVYIEARTREAHHKHDSYSSGSGFIVGKRGADELLVVTDNHVVGADKGEKLKDVAVMTADGIGHDAQVVHRTPTEDLALLAVKVDPDMAARAEIATAVKSISEIRGGDRILALGYPEDSEYLYASNGQVKGIAREKDLAECDQNNCYGENWNRPLINSLLNTKFGTSGGGVWNRVTGKIIGNIEGGGDHPLTNSYINPLTQDKIDNMIRHAKPWKKP